MDNKEKDFEIVEGDGTGINMSPVSDYIVSIKPQKSKAKKIVVPQEKKINKKKK